MRDFPGAWFRGGIPFLSDSEARAGRCTCCEGRVNRPCLCPALRPSRAEVVVRTSGAWVLPGRVDV